MMDIKNLILRCGGVHAEHPMKHYRCTKSDLERFAVAIRREALLEAAERFNCMGTFRVRDELRRMAKELE